MSATATFTRMLRLRSVRLSVMFGIVLLLGALGLQSASAVVPPGQISDAAHPPGRAGFYFLPPMVPDPGPATTPLDTTLSPTATICKRATSAPFACVEQVALFNTTGKGGAAAKIVVDQQSKGYITNWNVPKNLALSTTSPNPTYRLEVFVGTIQLGYADLYVVQDSNGLKNVPAGYIGVVRGKSFTIKFRIATSTVGTVTVAPVTATVGVGGTQVFTATVKDLHSAVINSPTVSWSSADTGIVTVSPASGTSTTATGVAGGTTQINATSGGVSGQANLQVGQPPVAVDDNFSINEDGTLVIPAPGVLANDSDPEGDPITAALATITSHGSLTFNSDGSFSYTPAANYNGADTFTYRAQDNHGGQSTEATVTLTVNPINDAPVAAGDSYTTDEDTPLVIPASGVLGNDTDVDGDVLITVLNTAPAHGSLSLNADGSFVYTPDADFNGPDSFTYHANDGTADSNIATVSITVNQINDAPVANNTNATTNEDVSVTITLSATDADGDSLTFTIVSNPTSGTLGSITPLNCCTATVVYTPDANANGVDSFTYVANDSHVDSVAATVNITVNPVNDAPSFTPGGDVTVNEDSDAYAAAWATAISAGPADEAGQAISFTVSNNNNGLFTTQPVIASNGTLTFTVAPDSFGSATVTVTLSDNGGTANAGQDTSPSVTFTITVNSVNDAPSFTPGGNVTVNEDSGPYSAAWATAISAGPNESGQDLIFNVTGNTNPGLFSVGPLVSASGILSFTPAANASGSTTITVALSDNGGTANGGQDTSPSQTFTITVIAV